MRLVPTSTLDGVTAITQVALTGTTTSASAVVAGLSPSTATINGALGVSGTGIPPYTYVASVDSTSQVTLTRAATASGSVSLTFTLEPITLGELKNQLIFEMADSDPAAVLNNGMMAGQIRAARLWCEAWMRAAFLTQSWTMYLDGFPFQGGYYDRHARQFWPSVISVPQCTGTLDIPLPPLRSVESVKYTDFAGVLRTVATTVYNVSTGFPGRIQSQYSQVWPISRPTVDSVQVAFTAGYGATAVAVPENVRLAIAMLAAHYYENRASVVGDPSAKVNFVVVPQGVESLLGSAEPGIYA